MAEITQLVGWNVAVERGSEITDDGPIPVWALVLSEHPKPGHPPGQPTDTYRFGFRENVRDFIVHGLTGVEIASSLPNGDRPG